MEEQNYLNALKELHLVLQHTEKITLKKIVDKHKLKYATTFGKTLKEGGIIQKTSTGYKWNTIEPNLAMAKEALKRNTERERMLVSQRRPETTSTVEDLVKKSPLKKVVNPKYYLGKIGFLSFKITPVYK